MKKKAFIKACFKALDKLEIEDLESFGGDPRIDGYMISRLELLKAIGIEINSEKLVGNSELLMEKIRNRIEERYQLSDYEMEMLRVLNEIREFVVNSYSDSVIPGLNIMNQKLAQIGLSEDPKMIRYIEGIPEKYKKWAYKRYSNIYYYSPDCNPEQREHVTEKVRSEFGITPKHTIDRFKQRAEVHFVALFDRYLKRHLETQEGQST